MLPLGYIKLNFQFDEDKVDNLIKLINPTNMSFLGVNNKAEELKTWNGFMANFQI